jgi:hypothetical protein
VWLGPATELISCPKSKKLLDTYSTVSYSFNLFFLAGVPFSYSLVEGDTLSLKGLSYEIDFENVDENWQKPATSLSEAKFCKFLSIFEIYLMRQSL